MPTGVLMHSIGKNNICTIHYYIIVNAYFTDDSRQTLKDIALEYDHKIDFFLVSNIQTDNLPFGKSDMPSQVSIATYYRLFLAELLPDNVHKILYLDGDMIVRKDLRRLWETDISGFAVGAVHDMGEMDHIDSNRLPYPMETGYFNAGMLLVNVDYWRDHNCTAKFMQFIQNNYEVIKHHDQDVLNAVFHDKKLWLPVTYNFQNGFLQKDGDKNYVENIKKEIEECKTDPAIIHYCAFSKPWTIYSFHPYNAVWRYYKKMSQWKDVPLEGAKPENIKQRIKFFLLRHDLWLPNVGYQRIRIKNNIFLFKQR